MRKLHDRRPEITDCRSISSSIQTYQAFCNTGNPYCSRHCLTGIRCAFCREHCRCRNRNGSCLSARGLYRRSGFSPCPEDMRLQRYINFRNYSHYLCCMSVVPKSPHRKLAIPAYHNMYNMKFRSTVIFAIATAICATGCAGQKIYDITEIGAAEDGKAGECDNKGLPF